MSKKGVQTITNEGHWFLLLIIRTVNVAAETASRINNKSSQSAGALKKSVTANRGLKIMAASAAIKWYREDFISSSGTHNSGGTFEMRTWVSKLELCIGQMVGLKQCIFDSIQKNEYVYSFSGNPVSNVEIVGVDTTMKRWIRRIFMIQDLEASRFLAWSSPRAG